MNFLYLRFYFERFPENHISSNEIGFLLGNLIIVIIVIIVIVIIIIIIITIIIIIIITVTCYALNINLLSKF